MAKRRGRVELDAINEDDFDLDMDISNEQGTVGSDPAPEAAHLQQPVFQRVVVLPAGSVAQLKIQKILEAGNAPILIPKSNPTPKEVVKREICDKCGKDLSKLKKSRDHKRYCGKVGPICPISLYVESNCQPTTRGWRDIQRIVTPLEVFARGITSIKFLTKSLPPSRKLWLISTITSMTRSSVQDQYSIKIGQGRHPCHQEQMTKVWCFFATGPGLNTNMKRRNRG